MPWTWFVTVSVGGLAVAGLFLAVIAGVLKDERRRIVAFRAGLAMLCISGVTLMLGAFLGWSGASEMAGGVVVILLGAGATLSPDRKAKSPASGQGEKAEG